MSLPKDLLAQAEHLVRRERRRPRQASLRRAVSTAYYALFHLLSEASARFLVSGSSAGREDLRRALRRSYVHADMKRVSHAFSNGSPPAAWQSACGVVSADLRGVAKTFVELQEARHQADYDQAISWSRQEADDMVRRARRAFDAWERARKGQDASAYLVALLAHQRSRFLS